MNSKYIKMHFLSLLMLLFVANAFAQEDFRQSAPAAGPAPKIEMGSAYQTELANGLKVIAVENHKLPRVSFQIFVDVPPINEGDKAGAARIAGELLSRGTTSKTKAEIDGAIDYIGASLSTSSSGMVGSSLTRHKETLLELMADVLMNPNFPESEFEKVKKTTLSGLAQSKEDPNAISSNVSQVIRYGKDHPYGEIETEESINNLTVDDCKKFYVDYFKPNISYLIVVGDITPKEVQALAAKYFSKWMKGAVATPAYEPVTMPEEAIVDFVDKAGAVQSVLSVTYPVNLTPGSPDVIKASVMNTMFGGFFGSRLNENVREDKGYSYGVRSSLRRDRIIGSFSAGGSVRNEVTDSTLIEFVKEMNRIRNEPISDDDLAMVKSVMSGSFARRLESPTTVASYALNIARYNLPSDYYQTYLEKLDAVTKQDILDMANKYIRPDKAHYIVVGNKDEVAEKLIPFATSGKVNFYDAFGNPVSETGATIPDGVTAETIIADYIEAIGGEDKLTGVKTVQSVANTTVQGRAMSMNVYQKAPNMSLQEIAMGGNVMQKIVFNGEKGAISAMGNVQQMPDEMANKMKSSHIFPELQTASRTPVATVGATNCPKEATEQGTTNSTTSSSSPRKSTHGGSPPKTSSPSSVSSIPEKKPLFGNDGEKKFFFQ